MVDDFTRRWLFGKAAWISTRGRRTTDVSQSRDGTLDTTVNDYVFEVCPVL